LDISELLRPESAFSEKAKSQFRDYTVDENDPLKERVRQTYELMHTNQTVEFVRGEKEISFLFWTPFLIK
jgi:inositol oxygenase